MISVLKYGEVENSRIFSRMVPEQDVSSIVREIINDVSENGDAALFRYEEQFDKVRLNSLEVSKEEMLEARGSIAPGLYEVIKEAAGNIREFHSHQLNNGFILDKPEGIVTGQRVLPIEKVGIYVPGGTAAYPSTVLMNAIPANIAGCSEIIMVTPPGKDGKISPALLAAAEIAGVSRVFKIGGAQAVAALAYGTGSVPKVDKIVGPGNVFVAEAKRQVFGRVAIDMIAGPSEILIVADGTCNPAYVAADLLSQAEHDRNASAVLITDSSELAFNVSDELEKQLSELEREEIARVSIDVNGKIIITDDIDTAIEIANEIAPEHLELCMDDPFAYLGKVKNAGSVFLGKYCPEALGDYFCGANHTLPTGGTARFSSPLSVEDFVKRTQYTYYTREAFSRDAEKIGIFASAEGLTGHGKSALIRVNKKTESGETK
ncbi:MAG: histidinol dehydrogenase [Lachnospiraceae bacterium]|nr:histidinol dehydrogenase [Lachnospiraceae bacterium]